MRRFILSMVLFALVFSPMAVSLAEAPAGTALEDEINDPFEGFNRKIFWFNDKADRYVLEPVAKGYEWLLPEFMRDGVRNFFSNLGTPVYLVSDVVQFKFSQAADHSGRFLVNSTIGLVGLMDVAKHMGLEHHDEDFGTALAYRDVPAGPYLVLPFLGPSNLRDGAGRIVDSFLNPLDYSFVTQAEGRDQWAVIAGSRALDLIDQRARMIEAINAARESSVDEYLFIQGAYYQYRKGLVNDGASAEEETFGFRDRSKTAGEARQ